MTTREPISENAEKLTLELRRGTLVLATLSRLREPTYGYALVQELVEAGFEVEQGTLYPLLRRLDEQGLLESSWDVDGSRPRKYYRLSSDGAGLLSILTSQWRRLVAVVDDLIDHGGEQDGAD
jgi:DNA-binding PadR family transcriptional regulator